MSSSILSWQISTAHAQPFRGARDLAFCLKVPFDSLLVWVSSKGSGETARMRRLAWTIAARIGGKYQIRLTQPNWLYAILTRCSFTQCWKGEMSQLMRLWYLSHRRQAKVQVSLRIRTVSPEPLLFAHMKYGSRLRGLPPKIRHLAPLDGCAFEEWVYGEWKYHNLMRWLKLSFISLWRKMVVWETNLIILWCSIACSFNVLGLFGGGEKECQLAYISKRDAFFNDSKQEWKHNIAADLCKQTHTSTLIAWKNKHELYQAVKMSFRH